MENWVGFQTCLITTPRYLEISRRFFQFDYFFRVGLKPQHKRKYRMGWRFLVITLLRDVKRPHLTLGDLT